MDRRLAGSLRARLLGVRRHVRRGGRAHCFNQDRNSTAIPQVEVSWTAIIIRRWKRSGCRSTASRTMTRKSSGSTSSRSTPSGRCATCRGASGRRSPSCAARHSARPAGGTCGGPSSHSSSRRTSSRSRCRRSSSPSLLTGRQSSTTPWCRTSRATPRRGCNSSTGGRRRGRDPYLDKMATLVIGSDTLEEKVFMMQVFFERLIIPKFKLIAKATPGTVLESMCQRLSIDDGIHHGAGVAYERVLLRQASKKTKDKLVKAANDLLPIFVEHELWRPPRAPGSAARWSADIARLRSGDRPRRSSANSLGVDVGESCCRSESVRARGRSRSSGCHAGGEIGNVVIGGVLRRRAGRCSSGCSPCAPTTRCGSGCCCARASRKRGGSRGPDRPLEPSRVRGRVHHHGADRVSPHVGLEHDLRRDRAARDGDGRDARARDDALRLQAPPEW